MPASKESTAGVRQKYGKVTSEVGVGEGSCRGRIAPRDLLVTWGCSARICCTWTSLRSPDARKSSPCSACSVAGSRDDGRSRGARRIAGLPTAPQRRWVLKIDIGNDRIPALAVFGSVLAFWTEFIYRRQIDRTTKRHADHRQPSGPKKSPAGAGLTSLITA